MIDDVGAFIARHEALARAARKALPQDESPFVATMRVETNGRVRDVLLGDRGHVGGGIVRIDHAAAPLAEVFWGVEPGDDYAIDVDDRTLEGALVDRALVRFDGGALVEVVADGRRWRRREGRWVEDAAPAMPGFGGPRRAGRFVGLDALDAEQRAAVEGPPGPLCVVGEAGSGKTTAALHRLVRLLRGRDLRAAVIVPTAGLAVFAAQQLERLGAPGVPVHVFDDWAWQQAARCVADWPARRAQDATAAVVDLKRSPRLLPELADLATALDAGVDRGRRADLIHLFGDSARMTRVAAGMPAGAVAEVGEHTHVQFSDPAEVAWSHVDAARLATVDRRLIDDGTPMQDAGTADVEDAAVVLELDRLLGGRASAKLRRYDALVLDEAQALAPIELMLVGRCVRPGGSLVVAGDAGQHMGPADTFGGWDAALAALGAADARRVALSTVYRSPPSLAAWARRLVEPGPAVEVPPDGIVVVHRAWHRCHLERWIIDGIEATSDGSVAVITRDAAGARRWAAALDRAVSVRHAPEGVPPGGAGVAVLPVAHARGLEFDVVIVPDADGRWTDAPADRRALYVAATRAAGRLVLATVGRFSPLLRDVEARAV